jgi:CRP/FNR family transcriptional regulator
MESATQYSCLQCIERPERLFCDLPVEALKAFDALKSTTECQRGTVLFREGSPSREVFVLCEGRARLSVCSESGNRLTLRIAGPGEVLGLSACLAGSPHEMTAELLDSTRVALVKRHDLMVFLHDHREACLQVISLLSQDLHRAYDRVRSVGLGRSRRSRSVRVH